ncbi:hypothetical protein SAMN02745221_02127 [Thermosyntropha lipolytica DSM 11003]|uniref:Uncharacterized protein n=1 Tax=Thermosyntropha lipolytica DSM 11003 TaxID=1123382 RepID=A0A1M5RXG0_9FIRM|nr:hypothetical protein [Thermosyntropha lipolytica]SHH30936.1 hypothetical protein SAMN02745221_02127 [Thermosyntropha lipolytica DSM 11003]
MIIIIRDWKRKVLKLLAVIILVMSFALAVPYMAGSLKDIIPVWNTFFNEERPTGNPMRVENERASRLNEIIDSLVFNLQDFYYED